MQNNKSLEEERQQQHCVKENEFDMINYMHARPVCSVSIQKEPIETTIYWPIRPTQKKGVI